MKKMGTRSKTLGITLLGVVTFLTLLSSIDFAQADVHYDSWSSWKYKTLAAGESYAPQTGCDGRYNVAGKRYLGIQKEVVVISGSGEYLIDDLHWCPSTGPGEMWMGYTTWQYGGIVWDHFTNGGPSNPIYFKYKWRIYWEDA